MSHAVDDEEETHCVQASEAWRRKTESRVRTPSLVFEGVQVGGIGYA